MSTKTAATAGPWHVNAGIRGHLYVESDSAEMRLICDMQLECAEPDERAMVDANAKLIAAAPTLLAALKDALLVFKGLDVAYPGEFVNAVASCEAAIAKAEGRQ